MDVNVRGSAGTRRTACVPAGTRLSIGRSSGCDVTLDADPALSRQALTIAVHGDGTVLIACQQSYGFTEITRDGRRIAVLTRGESRTVRGEGSYSVGVHNPGRIVTVSFEVTAIDSPAPPAHGALDPGTVGRDLRWSARYIKDSEAAERWIAAAAICGLLVRRARGGSREFYSEFHAAWEAWNGRRMRRGNSVNYPVERAMTELRINSRGNKVEAVGHVVCDLGLLTAADYDALSAELEIRQEALSAEVNPDQPTAN